MKIKGKHHHRCIPVTTWSPWAAGDVEHLQRTGSSISDSYADDSIHPPQLQETWHQLDMLQQRQHLMDQVRSLPDPKDGHTCTMAWICANLIQAIWVQLSRTLYGYCPSIVKHEGVLINLAIMRKCLPDSKLLRLLMATVGKPPCLPNSPVSSVSMAFLHLPRHTSHWSNSYIN